MPDVGFCVRLERLLSQVVGVHMVGPDAAEILQGVAIAMKCPHPCSVDLILLVQPTPY